MNKQRSQKIKNNNKPKRKRTTAVATSQTNRRLDRTGRHVSLQIQDVMPPFTVKRMNYIDAAYARNNPGGNYLVYSFRINDLYDPDPTILSGSISGLKEMMQFYQYYRVNHVNISFKIFNNETFAILYGAVFSQSNLTGVLSTRDDAINALENDFSTRARLLSAKSGLDHEDINFDINPAILLGDAQQYHASNQYSGNGLASPAIPLWCNFIIASPTGSVLTNGIVTALTFTFTSKFFGRLNLRA